MIDPQQARLIEQDRKLRAAMGVLADIAHANTEDLAAACDVIETHTRNADLLRKAAFARDIIKSETSK